VPRPADAGAAVRLEGKDDKAVPPATLTGMTAAEPPQPAAHAVAAVMASAGAPEWRPLFRSAPPGGPTTREKPEAAELAQPGPLRVLDRRTDLPLHLAPRVSSGVPEPDAPKPLAEARKTLEAEVEPTPPGKRPADTPRADAQGMTASIPPAAGQKVATLDAAPGEIAKSLLELLDQPPAAAPAPTPAGRPAPAAVHTLAIALRPEHLGDIELRMQVRGDELTVELRAADPEVVKRIDAEKDKIAAQLREAGFDPAISVQKAADGSATSQPQPASPSFARSGGEGLAGSGGQPRPEQSPRDGTRPRHREEGKRDAQASGASSDAVYL
jgi:hypothetical protein